MPGKSERSEKGPALSEGGRGRGAAVMRGDDLGKAKYAGSLSAENGEAGAAFAGNRSRKGIEAQKAVCLAASKGESRGDGSGCVV